MRFCITNPTLVNSDKIQEIRFPFRKMNEAMDYQQDHPDKTIILEIQDLKDPKMPSIDNLFDLQKQFPFIYDFFDFTDFVIYCKSTTLIDQEWRNVMYHYAATTWAMVHICTYYHARNIMVGEPLVFQCRALEKLRHQGYIIRANPQCGVNPAIADTNANALQHFWVLPQHLHLYENYIDVFELYMPTTEQERGLIELYSTNYPYSLDLLIREFPCPEQILGSEIDESFAEARLDCGQRCLTPLGTCHKCLQPMYEKKIKGLSH